MGVVFLVVSRLNNDSGLVVEGCFDNGKQAAVYAKHLMAPEDKDDPSEWKETKRGSRHWCLGEKWIKIQCRNVHHLARRQIFENKERADDEKFFEKINNLSKPKQARDKSPKPKKKAAPARPKKGVLVAKKEVK